MSEKLSEKFERWGIYLEHSFNGKWCYKVQLPNLDVIIVSDVDKEKAASNFFIEYLKGIHYSIMVSRKLDRPQDIEKLVAKLKEFKDENVDKTIEIAMRQANITNKNP